MIWSKKGLLFGVLRLQVRGKVKVVILFLKQCTFYCHIKLYLYYKLQSKYIQNVKGEFIIMFIFIIKKEVTCA